MASIWQTTWDYLRGADLKLAPAPAPPAAPPAPEVKQIVPTWSFTTDGYPPDAFGGAYWNPVTTAFGGTPYTLNSAIFACLKVLAQAFQEAPLRVYRALADGTDEWLDEHPLMDLLADPHPSLSQPELNWWLCSCLNVNGNAYLRKIRNRAGGVVQLWPISPANMSPETTADDQQAGVFISHYVYDDGRGKHEDVAVEDVVHFRMGVDDADHRLGVSALRRLVRELSSDEEATRFTDAVLRNTGVTSLAVTIPPGPQLTQEQADQVRERLQESLTGSNRGRIGVVANGATIQQLGFSPQQLDLKVAHHFPESRIAAVMGVPAMLVGFSVGLEHTIYNNMEQAQEHLYEQTMTPLWRQLAATYTKQLLRVDYTPDRQVRLRYDTSKVRALEEDEDAKFARYSLAVEKGWVTKDEARAAVGLEPLPNGLGEAKDPLELARQMAALRPPPGQQGQDGQQQQDGNQPPGGQKALQGSPVVEHKQQSLAYLPGLMALLETMARPMLQQDLESYFDQQRERVLAKAKDAA